MFMKSVNEVCSWIEKWVGGSALIVLGKGQTFNAHWGEWVYLLKEPIIYTIYISYISSQMVGSISLLSVRVLVGGDWKHPSVVM